MEHFYKNIHGWFTFPNLYKSMIERVHNGHFVEVGVWQGKSAAYMAVEIANSGKPIKFDCIDPWTGSEEHLNPDSPAYFPQLVDDPEFIYKKFKENMKPVEHIYTAVRKPSLEAVHDYEDGSLDFVFIDGAHDYFNVNADVIAWKPKVKRGGILAGHDYTWSAPVKKAVDDALGESNVKVEKAQGCWKYLV